MGWYFNTYQQTKKEFVNEIINGYDENFEVESSLKGNHLWLLITNKLKSESYIMLYLLSSNNKCWGYKPISEEAGPAYYDCPKKFIIKQPIIRNEYSANWRIECDNVRKIESLKKNGRNF